MNTDYLDAHDRHWQDAGLLFASTRIANADHLYGMAAECGLKRLMVAFGMTVENDGGPADKSDRIHANHTW
ncbi:MAG: SAM-dependent methyltransferase, partial [Deltaproteobacteria bacterium]